MKPAATCCCHFLPAVHEDVEETPLGLVSGSLCWRLALPLPNYATLAKSLNLSEPSSEALLSFCMREQYCLPYGEDQGKVGI